MTQHTHPKNSADKITVGSHQLEPVESLDLDRINDSDELLQAMSKTAFGGRSLGEATDVFYEMVTDPDCFVVLTLAGAMTVAKMGLLVCDMIERNMIQAIVATGALITHGLVENTGMSHFKYNFDIPDVELYKEGFDRVYDTLEREQNLDDLELIVNEAFKELPPGSRAGSYLINRKIGEYLSKQRSGRGILKSAYEHHVPVYIPSFTDSELGLDFSLHNRRLKSENKEPIFFDSYDDLEHFTSVIFRQKTTGIFTIGGGVPRNWAQQVGPYLDLIRFRLVDNIKDRYADRTKQANPYLKFYKYGVRICPEPVYWGGLSGCTYSEGVSWGKFYDQKSGGRFAEVLSDATLVWPLLLKGVSERLKKNGLTMLKKNYANDQTLQSVAF